MWFNKFHTTPRSEAPKCEAFPVLAINLTFNMPPPPPKKKKNKKKKNGEESTPFTRCLAFYPFQVLRYM